MFARSNGFLCAVALICLSLAALGARPLHAQVAGATLSGLVSNDSDTPVAEATVSIRNVLTGFIRVSTTDKDGQYTAPNLLPGLYEITASASGYATSVQHDVS